jgi:cytoskeletal protein CcmA (bactofilin family)
MFGKKSESKPQGRIDTLIGVGTLIEGDIIFSGGIRIDGQIKGNVQALDTASSSTLVLSEQGRIEGDVSVAHLVMNGQITGGVSISQTLEMQSRARIVGDVVYVSIEMQQGAVIEGRLLHHAKSEELKEPASN